MAGQPLGGGPVAHVYGEAPDMHRPVGWEHPPQRLRGAVLGDRVGEERLLLGDCPEARRHGQGMPRLAGGGNGGLERGDEPGVEATGRLGRGRGRRRSGGGILPTAGSGARPGHGTDDDDGGGDEQEGDSWGGTRLHEGIVR